MKRFIPNHEDIDESDDDSIIDFDVIDEANPDPNDMYESEGEESWSTLEEVDEAIDDKEIVYEDTTSEEEDLEEDIDKFFNVPPNPEANRNNPRKLTQTNITDICYHPHQNVLATCNMDGEVIIYKCSIGKPPEQTSKHKPHTESCRKLCYNQQGDSLFTISKDKSFALLDINADKPKLHLKDAHEAELYSFMCINDNLCVTGDDEGVIKLWDIRKKTSIFKYKCGSETVADLICDEDGEYMIASVFDGTITGFSLNPRKFDAQSLAEDTEFMSLSLIRNESKLTVGGGDGMLYLYDWQKPSYATDSFPGHPDAVNCQIAIDDKLILTGCEDGSIRALTLFPNRFIGVVGQHEYGVDALTLSADGSLIASCCSQVVQFWNISYLMENQKTDETEKLTKTNKRASQSNLKTSNKRNKSDFFSDLGKSSSGGDNDRGPVGGPSSLHE